MKRDALLAFILFALALWLNLSSLHVTPFHPDETRWLNRAHDIHDLTHPLGETWRDGYLTRGQPPLGSYLIGLGLLLQGRDLATNGVWDFRFSSAWNAARGNMASPADLDAGRRTNAVVGALTVAVVYLLGTQLSNRVSGVVAALFLADHPLMIHLSSQALSDALVALLIALAALAACRLAARPTWPRTVLLGALLGLGGATKLSPLLLALLLAAFGVGLLAHAACTGRVAGVGACPDDPLGWRLAALPVIAAAVFVAVSPYLWPDPIDRTRNLFAFRVQEMGRQGFNWPGVAVPSRASALHRVALTLGDQFTLTDRLVAGATRLGGIPWRPRGLDLLLALVGAGVLLAGAVRAGPRSRHTLVLLTLGGEAGLVILGLRSDFARYHLPILLGVALCVGLVAGQFWVLLERRVARLHWLDRARALIPHRLPSAGSLPTRLPLNRQSSLTAVVPTVLGRAAQLVTRAPEPHQPFSVRAELHRLSAGSVRFGRSLPPRHHPRPRPSPPVSVRPERPA